MNKVKQIFGGDTRQLGMITALVALLLCFQIWSGGLIITPNNFNNILQGNAYILVLAVGMVLVIIAGHIDLSVGSVCAFVGATVALAIRTWDLPWPAAILLGIALGILVGMWQGSWVAYVGIPASIVTLAGLLLFRGLDLSIPTAQSIPVPDASLMLSRSS